MKKFLSIIGCIIILAAASSCTKNYVTPNPNIMVNADIPSAEWILSPDKTSYQVTIGVKEITTDFNHYGGLIVSIWDVSAFTNETYEQIPEVFGGISLSYTTDAGDANHSGSVTLFAQSPDGTAPVKPTDDYKAKIILVASN
jgi:hypothetical protein